jgi:hypothetical protein
MAITVNISSGIDREPVSEGLHSAILADIVDLGVIDTGFGPKRKLQFTWLTDEADEEGKTKYLFNRYTASLHEKATLRKDFAKIAGRDLTADELASKDLDIEGILLGRQNTVVVEHSEDPKTGKVYANIATFMKPQGAKLAVPADFQRKKDRQPQPQTQKSVVKAAGGGKAVAAAAYKPAPITDDDIPF